jgi:ParB-like chromosome segregation protein Spo0J
MQQIIQVPTTSIDANPFRLLAVYPYVETKVASLVRSIADVGLWPSVIARRSGDRYQIAFGHHRIEAARQAKLDEVALIIEDLSDKQMLEYMGRENMEDFNAEFLVMLESWEAATAYVSSPDPAKIPQEADIAKLLGWTRVDPKAKDLHRPNHTAQACANASKLLADSYLTRKDLRGLSVQSVLDLCGRVIAHHQQIERMAKKTNRPAKEVAAAKRESGKAGVRVAKDVRAGRVAPKEIRGQVDVEAYRHAREAKKENPLFSMFGNSLIESIRKMASTDSAAEKFEEIKKSLALLTLDEDIEIVKRIAFECGSAAERFGKWQKAFADPKRKVVNLKEIAS